MSHFYTPYSDLIDCNAGDKVYVYQKDILINGTINTSMIGVVESIEQEIWEDWSGMEYLSYSVSINMKNDEKIKISNDPLKIFFGKYKFITLKDLKKFYNIAKEDI